MYKTAIKIRRDLKKAVFVFIVPFIFYRGVCQQTNVLKLPIELTSLRIGVKLDTTSFIRIDRLKPISRRISIYKFDYIYFGKSVSILDSVEVKNLLIGTNADGNIQSIVILCKNHDLLKQCFSIFGNSAGVSSFLSGKSSQKTYLWQKGSYCVSIKTSTDSTEEEDNCILILYDCDYRHLFKKKLTDSISVNN